LATELDEGKVVVFHYDGDTPWTRRRESVTKQPFAALRVRLSQVSGKQSHLRPARLLEMVPHYSIEAWVYQATAAAVELCETHYHERDVALFRSWSVDRGLLDELEQPKSRTVLGSKHNAELARHIPVPDIVRARKSLSEFLRQLNEVPELSRLLRDEVAESLAP
jgi:hypothetical protein